MKSLINCIILFIFCFACTAFLITKFVLPEEPIQGDYSKYLANKNSDLIIFTIKSCKYCNKAKRLLDEKKINYFEVDIEEKDVDSELMSFYKRLDKQSVPIIITKSKVFIGFYEKDVLNAVDYSQ